MRGGGALILKVFLIFSLVALEFNIPKDGFSFFPLVFPACSSDQRFFFLRFLKP